MNCIEFLGVYIFFNFPFFARLLSDKNIVILFEYSNTFQEFITSASLRLNNNVVFSLFNNNIKYMTDLPQCEVRNKTTRST